MAGLSMLRDGQGYQRHQKNKKKKKLNQSINKEIKTELINLRGKANARGRTFILSYIFPAHRFISVACFHCLESESTSPPADQ